MLVLLDQLRKFKLTRPKLTNVFAIDKKMHCMTKA